MGYGAKVTWSDAPAPTSFYDMLKYVEVCSKSIVATQPLASLTHCVTMSSESPRSLPLHVHGGTMVVGENWTATCVCGVESYISTMQLHKVVPFSCEDSALLCPDCSVIYTTNVR